MTIANLVLSFILVYQCRNVSLDITSRLESARKFQRSPFFVQFDKHLEMVEPDKYIIAYKRREKYASRLYNPKTYTPSIKV